MAGTSKTDSNAVASVVDRVLTTNIAEDCGEGEVVSAPTVEDLRELTPRSKKRHQLDLPQAAAEDKKDCEEQAIVMVDLQLVRHHYCPGKTQLGEQPPAFWMMPPE